MSKRRMSVSRPTVRRHAVVLWALVVGACASTDPNVRVQQADAGVAQCRSFDWLPTSKEAATLTEQRVRAAVLAELQAKGYAQDSKQPDCRMTYVLSLHERPASRPRVGVGAGGGSGGIGGGIGVSLPIGRKNQQAGTFTLDVVDVQSKAQVWTGALDVSFASTELSEEEARDVVRAILSKLPDRVR